LDMIKVVEKSLKDDVTNAVFTSRKTRENPQFKKSSTIVSQRRRSVGHYTISKMINLAQNDSGMAIAN